MIGPGRSLAASLLPTTMRLDKWLHVARIFKTRNRATQACVAGRVRVNGLMAKAHRTVTLEDRLEIHRGDWKQILIVKGLYPRSLPKAEARRLYRDQTPPRPPADPLARLFKRPFLTRSRGTGRPTKKDRRQLQRLKNDSE